MCERLEWLYKGLESLIGGNSMSNKLVYEFSSIISYTKHFCDDYIHTMNSFKEITKERDFLLLNSEEVIGQNTSFEEMKNNIMKVYKESIKSIKLDLENEITEKDKLKAENSELEKKYSEVCTELTALKKKTQRANFKKNSEIEKICKNCGKIFSDSENFYWSCKTHQNKYNGVLY